MENIDLKTFLDGYKTAELVLGDTKRKFREPALKDMGLSIEQMLTKYCLEWDPKKFFEVLEEMPKSKYKEALDSVLGALGLV